MGARSVRLLLAGSAAVTLALSAASPLSAPELEGRRRMGPVQRLLGPIASAAASVEWARYVGALDAGDVTRAYGHAARALSLDSRAAAGWLTLADHFIFIRASPLEEADPAARRRWIREGFAVLRSGELRAASPGVLARFLDHRLFKLLMLPTKGGLRVFGTAAQPILKAIGRVVGSDVLADAVAFFQAFAGMETGFRERADEVVALIRSPETTFIVVASPRHDTIAEAVWFARQLVEQGVGAGAAIINRTQPAFGDGSADDATAAAEAAGADDVLASLWRNVAELRTLRERELDVMSPLAAIAGDDAVATLPLLASDVHDLEGLLTIADHLFGRT